MKTSVLIPCIPEHFVYLERVIDAYEKGTTVPHEFIIILSDCEKVPNMYRKLFDLKTLEGQPYNFRLIEYSKLLWTGAACRAGEEQCTGDIIMIHGCDDIPHPRRVEIVESHFEKYDIISLNHAFIRSTQQEYKPSDKPIEDIKVVQPHTLYDYHFGEDGKPDEPYGQNCGFHVGAGPMCYRRDIVGKFEWSNARRGQDQITCKQMLKKFKKSICIDAPIYYYLIRD